MKTPRMTRAGKLRNLRKADDRVVRNLLLRRLSLPAHKDANPPRKPDGSPRKTA